MIINEIFYSLQGEGFLVGIPSVFIRLTGCPLRCRWCDTKYAWSEQAGRQYSIDEIIKTIQQWPCTFIVITGGEPMVNPDLSIKSDFPELLEQIKAQGKHITIETSGIGFLPDLDCDLMSISPKLSNSAPADPELSKIHEDSRLDIAVLRKLIDDYEYQLKFVVDSQDDLLEIQQTVEELGTVDVEKIMLMPQAATRDELLAKSPMVAELCKQSSFTFCQRLQVLLWNNERGT